MLCIKASSFGFALWIAAIAMMEHGHAHNAISIYLEVEPGKIQAGDIFYARLVCKNLGKNRVVFQRPYAPHNFDLILKRDFGRPKYSALVTRGSDFDNPIIGNAELLAGKSKSFLLMLRAVSEELFSPVARGDPKETNGVFELSVTTSIHGERPKDSVLPDGHLISPAESEFRQGRTLNFSFTYPPICFEQEVLIKIHGDPFSERHATSGLVSDSFPVDVTRWKRIRSNIDATSNLWRLLDFSERYLKIVQSKKLEPEIASAIKDLLKEMRPLERQFIHQRMLAQARDRFQLVPKLLEEQSH